MASSLKPEISKEDCSVPLASLSLTHEAALLSGDGGRLGACRHFTRLFRSTAGNKTPDDLAATICLPPVTLLTHGFI